MNVRSITISHNSRIERHVTRAAEETAALAARLIKTIHGGDVIALSGELGAGKTTFVQGLARALGIREHVTSPTFVLMKVYQLKKSMNGITRLCHIDAYRLGSADELAAIGAGEYIGDAQTLTIIEWPERVSELILKSAIHISFDHPDQRYGRRSIFNSKRKDRRDD